MNHFDYFKIAAEVAVPKSNIGDFRNFWLGCAGLREDGAIVTSRNGPVSLPDKYYQQLPYSHAEGRVLRKLGQHGILYVSRVLKNSGQFGMARPCEMCSVLIQSKLVKKVYYSINEFQYGVWSPEKDRDVVYNF